MKTIAVLVVLAILAVASGCGPGEYPEPLAQCTAAADQLYPVTASDGSVGAIVAWQDARTGAGSDIFAQKVTAVNAVAWAADGVGVCQATGDQYYPRLIPAAAGGAILCWHDARGGAATDVYAQLLNSSGAAQWTADGVLVCNAADVQNNTAIVSDGAGGAVIAWLDYRTGTPAIYIQRLNASGAAQWTSNGVAVCTAAGDRSPPRIVADGSGGAIVAWHDDRDGDYDVYAQRVNASGGVQWAPDGITVSGASGDQYYPEPCSDGSGGVIMAWHDNRAGNFDIYAQRVNASGAAQWTADGVAVSAVAFDQFSKQVVADGYGGAIVVWVEQVGVDDFDIAARRVSAAGSLSWADDTDVCTASGKQEMPQVVSDGSHGAIVVWQDSRPGSTGGLYVQRLDGSGSTLWADDGVPIAANANQKLEPQLAPDESGGAFVVWHEYVSSPTDIYGRKVTSEGDLR